MANAPRDENRVTTVLGTSRIDGRTPIPVYANPSTNALLSEQATGMQIPIYDYVSLAISPATTETYTFKSGGSGGTTVATITIVYTDSTRSTISTVTKS